MARAARCLSMSLSSWALAFQEHDGGSCNVSAGWAWNSFPGHSIGQETSQIRLKDVGN